MAGRAGRGSPDSAGRPPPTIGSGSQDGFQEVYMQRAVPGRAGPGGAPLGSRQACKLGVRASLAMPQRLS